MSVTQSKAEALIADVHDFSQLCVKVEQLYRGLSCEVTKEGADAMWATVRSAVMDREQRWRNIRDRITAAFATT